ncbi:unnamed protein product [Angiostrongylus costaricensis]|uniref:WD repeat-containing protein CG11141 n=1 Tax=Angiostrongylus costaricensis TaxID=334426 RepID=A0A158PGP5_ANGCS|nr:unnamed protein product [Angiostrongylus costaricensis]
MKSRNGPELFFVCAFVCRIREWGTVSSTFPDGTVYMCVSPKEGLLAVGSESGRIHVIAFSSSPSPFVHLLTRDSRKLSKVTCLAWSTDSKTLYSGHVNGLILAHHTGANYFFRSSCTTLATFNDGDIVQLDVNSSKVLVSTQRASYICDIDGKNIIQIGKKIRNGPMGACFFPSGTKNFIETVDGFVLAARPNGRVWESNFAGVVYSDLMVMVTFFQTEMILLRIKCWHYSAKALGEKYPSYFCANVPFVLSVFGSYLVIFDVEQSKIVLLNISCWCVCGPDVFVLLRGASIPRKYTLCCRTTVLKRLLAKSLFTQSADFILHFKTCFWPNDLVSIAVDSLPQVSKEAEVERLRLELSKLLQRQNNLLLDVTNEFEGAQSITENPSVSRHENSGSDCGGVKTTAGTTKDSRCQIDESDSLKTLLQLESNQEIEAVQFVPTITVGNAAKSLAQLAISTPTSFSCFEPTGNGNASTPKDNSTMPRRFGPNIVKTVRPYKVKISLLSEVAVRKDISEESKNQINANNLSSISSVPVEKESMVPLHDNENNVEAHWVIDRLVNLQSEIGQGHDSLDLTPENVHPNRKKTLERCLSVDEDRLLHILFGSCFMLSDEDVCRNCSSSPDGAHSTAVSENDAKYPNKIRTFDHESSCDKYQEMLSVMDWLLDLDARVIMAIASLVIGYQELISLVKESPSLLSSLLPEHWSALTFLCVRDQAMKKNEVSAKVISDILHSFSLDRFVNVDYSNTVVLGKLGGIKKQMPMYSWIIDCNKCCFTPINKIIQTKRRSEM